MKKIIIKAVLVLLLTLLASTLKIKQSTASAGSIYSPGWKTVYYPDYYVCSCPRSYSIDCKCLIKTD